MINVFVPCSSSFQEFIQCIQGRLFPYLYIFVCRITLYWDGCNTSNLIQIVLDMDVYWFMLIMSKFLDNGFVVVVDSAPVGSVGNTLCLNNKVNTQQPTHNVSGIIGVDSFDSPNDAIPIKVGVKFKTKSILKKVIYMLALNNSFEFVTVRSNRTSYDIRCKDLSCSWYLRASVFKKSDIGIVHKFTDTHQCVVDIVKNDHRQATFLIVSECTKSFFKMNDKLHATLLVLLIT